MYWFGMILTLFLAGCVTTTKFSHKQDDSRLRPIWIDNPGEGVSASAAFHVRGITAQEELAVSRAREELAKRKGVRVDSESNIQQQYSNSQIRTATDKTVRETVSGQIVKSVIKAKWLEPGTGILWVWVVPD